MNKKTLTIAIPAYNESVTIGNLLGQLVNQYQSSHSLKSITVYNDGSIDNTLKIINNFKFKKLYIKNFKKREGKMYRLNQIFKNSNDDILVILDADIALSGKDFIDRLIKPLINKPKVIMSAARQIPVRPDNFWGKVAYQSFINWSYVKESMADSDSVQNFGGAATAYKKSFYKYLKIPKYLNEERNYIYYKSKELNGFYFNKQASIYFWPVSTLRDIVNLTHRSFGKYNSKLDSDLNVNTLKTARVSFRNKIKGVFKAFFKNPVYTPIALVLNFVIAKLKIGKSVTEIYWEISTSTKKPYTRIIKTL